MKNIKPTVPVDIKSGPTKTWGNIKQFVVLAKMHDMTAEQAARHFNAKRNSIYIAAQRLGIKLKSPYAKAQVQAESQEQK